MGNKAVELLWMVEFEGLWVEGECGWVVASKSHSSSSSSFSFLSPSQNEPAASGQLPKPLPDNNMGKKKPQLNRRGEKEKEESHSVATTVGML